jgi:signal transduction histidine kinase/CheY-like chemotaxis protein/CHASE3 domain sensor protein
MQKKISNNLQIGFGISIIILFLSSIISFVSIKKLQDSTELVSLTRDIIEGTNLIINLTKDAETHQRGFLLTGKESFTNAYHKSLEELTLAIPQVKLTVAHNPKQSQKINLLETAIEKRLELLQRHIENKQNNIPNGVAELEIGKLYMERAVKIALDIKNEANETLVKRSNELKRITTFASIITVLVSLFAIILSIVFYIRFNKDYRKREALQQVLRQKDINLTNRINFINNLADKISKGDYSIRIKQEERDGLGSLTSSLNNMASSLEQSFKILKDNEWIQKGSAILNQKLVGNKSVETLCEETLNHLIHYGSCVNGALYLIDNGKLKLQTSYGLENKIPQFLSPNEGMIGQVFQTGKERILENLEETDYLISYSNGEIKVRHILVVPIFYENATIGVIELGSFKPFEKMQPEFYRRSIENIGNAIISAKSRNHIQKLLEETQTQTEELQAQHSELENLNTELEIQTQKLQASEEELRVHQDEILKTNQHLEEHTKLLEEKNELILKSNLEIQKKAEELSISTKYKSEFLANMSHELRTPLNSILLLSHLLTENLENNLTEDQIESAKVIESSGNGLLNLIDEILDLSKIEAGKMDLNYEKVDLLELKANLFNVFSPIVKSKNLDFEISIKDDVDLEIESDKMRLDQILKNLLSNAIKFTSQGNVSLTIKNKHNDPEKLVFSIKDTGIGISPNKQNLIFEAFQQADGSTKRKFGGTGLGLSISRELTKLLQGEIIIESEEGKGSIFSLIIPKKQPTEAIEDIQKEEFSTLTSDEDVEKELEENKSTPFLADIIPQEIEDDRNNITTKDKVILIVEDDTNFAKTILKFTQKQNYKGIVIVRGDLATEFAEKYSPLAILLDIQLPVKDGWQVMDELKSNPKTKHIPVHMMSSLKVKRESISKGAIDFINKPIAVEQMGNIFKKIDEALNSKSKKVLIVEDNAKHATALSYFLSDFDVQSEIKTNILDSISALKNNDINCVILDMGIPDQSGYQILERIKQESGLENLPIIIFTGKNLSKSEEIKIKEYADSIVIKTAHSYQRILDEVGLFLHLVEENKSTSQIKRTNNLGSLNEVLKGKTVLLADDDVRNIFSLTKVLEKYQMNIVTAIDGKDALLQLENTPNINIILMDMMMPEMDGYETIKRIRSLSKFKNTPIIAVTAKAMMGDREKCIIAGASDYISKPVDTDQLLSLLRVWLYES